MAKIGKKISEDIFHYLEMRSFLNEDEIEFVLIDDKSTTIIYKPEDICYIPDPCLDANFKAIFVNKPERFENFLNSVYFKPKNMEVSNLVFLVGDFNTIGQKYNINCLRADIACKGKIKIKTQDGKEEKETLLDIEIQINWIENLDDRLFEYASLLRNSYSNQLREEQHNKKESKKRIYLDTLVIAFIVENESNPSNEINLTKKEVGFSPVDLNNFKIVEINLFKEWYSIRLSGTSGFYNNKKISKDAKDWIKLICLRAWAKKDKKSFAKYAFPKLPKGQKYSNNKYIEETIIELIMGNRIIMTYYYEIENYSAELEKQGEERGEARGEERGIKIGEERGIKIGEERGEERGIAIGREMEKKKVKDTQLESAFYLFCFKKNIDKYHFDYKYKMEDILLFFVEKVDLELKDDNMADFINALEKKEVIEK